MRKGTLNMADAIIKVKLDCTAFIKGIKKVIRQLERTAKIYNKIMRKVKHHGSNNN